MRPKLFALTLTFGLLTAPVLAGEPPGSPGEVELAVELLVLVDPPDRREATLVLLDETGEPVGSLPLPAAGEHRLTVPAAAALSCRGERVWCPTVELDDPTPDAEPPSVFLPVLTRRDLSGSLRTAGRSGLPGELVVQGWARLDPEQEPIASFTATVPVDEEGRFRFEAPGTLLDLRLAAADHAAVYRWGIEPGAERLGRLRLVPGSSVSGFVVDAVDLLPEPGARVVAAPAGSSGSHPDRRRGAPALPSAVADERGFFQIVGLPSGTYRLEASAAERTVASVEPVEIEPGSETLLREAILLTEPLALTLHVSPPADAGGLPWQGQLVPRVAPAGGPFLHEGRTNESGTLRLANLRPGSYRLRILDAEGGIFETRTVELSDDTVLDLDLPLVELVGTVRLGDDPLRARLEIETGSRDEAFFESDEEGEFGGWLREPEHRVLFVTVQGHEPPFERRLTVREPEVEDGVVHLDLELADTSVPGEVVDPDGRPVPGARVELYTGADVVARSTTGEDGAFTFVAIEPGSYRLTARHRRHGDAEPVEVAVVADRETPDQRLVLHERKDVRAIVLSSTGQPLAGIGYELMSLGPVPTISARRRTDLEGRLRERIGAAATHLFVRIYAPGQVLWSGCLPVPDEGPAEIVLPPPPGGRLEIELLGDDDHPPLTSGELVLFDEGGGFFSSSNLWHWQREIGVSKEAEPIDVPRLAADRRYGAAWVNEPWPLLAARACGLAPLPDVDWRYLPPGGSVRLEVDVAKLQRRAARPR